MKFKSILCNAVVVAGLMGAVSGAHAAELQFNVAYGFFDPGVIETFDVDTSAMGALSQASAADFGSSLDADFAITNDSLGNSVLQVGNGDDNNYFATGSSDDDAFSDSPTFTTHTSEGFYDGSSLFLQAMAGDTATAQDGTLINITGVSAAPEPSTWTLMVAGVGMIGGMLRFARRRGLGLAGG